LWHLNYKLNSRPGIYGRYHKTFKWIKPSKEKRNPQHPYIMTTWRLFKQNFDCESVNLKMVNWCIIKLPYLCKMNRNCRLMITRKILKTWFANLRKASPNLKTISLNLRFSRGYLLSV
jgi:hypothetical protein